MVESSVRKSSVKMEEKQLEKMAKNGEKKKGENGFFDHEYQGTKKENFMLI